MKNVLNIGMDVGSTTVKLVVMDNKKEILYSEYRRHFSDTKKTIKDLLNEVIEKFPKKKFKIVSTGSGAITLAKYLDIAFIQEVIACKNSIKEYAPSTDVAIELGGEDAKIIYFDQTIEQRMNGTCAGGTGAFLDQMAVLLNTDTEGLNEYAKEGKTIYPIASRCGVFAKTDIQPLLNEGAKKEDIALSILQAVVNQTIGGLACGKPIKGNVIFLGGPLNYLSMLKDRFIKTLDLKEDEIIRFKEYNNLNFLACACKFTESLLKEDNDKEKSQRLFIKLLIKRLKNEIPNVEENLFKAVENVDLDAVVRYFKDGKTIENY